jgi:RNA polymerase sigma-70 factor (ECF subfamily)
MTKPGRSHRHKGFEEETLPHIDLLHSFARRMTNSREDAADLVQETYIKAFRFWASYEQGTNVKAWLFRILRNTYINRYKQELREPVTVDFESTQNSSRPGKHPPHTASDMGVGNLLEDDVAKALAELPDEFRTVVILSDNEGLTYAEIADFVDSPVGTVRSRLHRGRKLLRAKLLECAQKKGAKK